MDIEYFYSTYRAICNNQKEEMGDGAFSSFQMARITIPIWRDMRNFAYLYFLL